MQAVILAAGESSRFWPFNSKHKSLFKIMGKPLIWYTIQGLKKAGVNDVIIVQSPKREIEKTLRDYPVKIKFVVQQKPIGSGNAVYQAKNFIKGRFLVVGPHKADLNNYLPTLLQKSRKSPEKVCLVGVKTQNPWDYGVLKMKGNKVSKIIENPPKGREPSVIKATEVYILPADFFAFYKKTSPKEDNFIEAINLIIKKRGAEHVLLKEDSASLKYPWHLLSLAGIMLKSGDFKNYISPSATIGENVVIKGKVYIGDNCQIGANNVLRGPMVLEDNVVTGAFCEIKNSVIGSNTHFHSGYVGDSVIGENCRFGAGFITANRRTDRADIKSLVKKEKINTGLTHLGAMIGDNTHFGIHSGTMPGVIIGSKCSVGPGTLVFDNIEDNTTFYTKFEKVVKKNV